MVTPHQHPARGHGSQPPPESQTKVTGLICGGAFVLCKEQNSHKALEVGTGAGAAFIVCKSLKFCHVYEGLLKKQKPHNHQTLSSLIECISKTRVCF